MKNKSNNTGKAVTDDMRFVCDSWDKPTVEVTAKGKGRMPARKVVTNGVVRFQIDSALVFAKHNLRLGKEVRLTEDGEDAIRLIPVMDTAFDKILVCAQTMGDFRDKTLADKKVRFTRRGNEVAAEAMKVFAKSKKAEASVSGGDGEAVTPDMMVKCPKCGYAFRVGRRVAA